MSNNVQEALIQVSDIVATSIEAPSFDKTVTGTIKGTYDDPNLYRVQINNFNCDAKVINNETYHVGQMVYITILQGDYSNDKIIIGTAEKSEQDQLVAKYNPLKDVYDMSKWVINDFPFTVYTNKPITSTGFTIPNIKIGTRDDYFITEVAFETDLTGYTGEYFLNLYFRNASNQTLITRTISSANFYGNPYFTTSEFKYKFVSDLREVPRKNEVTQLYVQLLPGQGFKVDGEKILLMPLVKINHNLQKLAWI